jgi:alpha/beta superfamily hydrolase
MSRPCTFDEIISERVRIRADSLHLEGELAYPGEGRPAGAVVLAGPHPLLGGTMHNNVVRALGEGLARRGLLSLRFDYRDGTSLGEYLAAFWEHSTMPGEALHADDLRAAVAYTRYVAGKAIPLALVGYSFGCSLLPAAVKAGKADVLVLIAPTVGTHDLGAFANLPQPRLVIAPRGDFAANEEDLLAWFVTLHGPRELCRPVLDGHFFRGHEDWLVDRVGSFIDRQWRAAA